MVCASTPRFGMIVEVNLSRTFLHRAHTALEAGNLYEAGVLLREAVRRQLFAECAWFDCLPRDTNRHRSPLAMLHALTDAGHYCKDGFHWVKEMIDVGNKAAHCCHVDPHVLRGAISLLHQSIDATPCGEPRERVGHCKPVVESYDDGWDDDGANWWKGVPA